MIINIIKQIDHQFRSNNIKKTNSMFKILQSSLQIEWDRPTEVSFSLKITRAFHQILFKFNQTSCKLFQLPHIQRLKTKLLILLNSAIPLNTIISELLKRTSTLKKKRKKKEYSFQRFRVNQGRLGELQSHMTHIPDH